MIVYTSTTIKNNYMLKAHGILCTCLRGKIYAVVVLLALDVD